LKYSFDNIAKPEYIRDGRSPIPKSDVISRVMSRNRSKNTKPELLLRKELFKTGIKGYRLHPRNVPGSPDICFKSLKIAIFANGCFWHRCPYCKLKLPVSNRNFWRQKFKKNVIRDITKNNELKKKGWIVITIWECQIKKNILKQVQKIEHKYLSKK
jgi:DNA mismatch endonuclease, patch repair protein